METQPAYDMLANLRTLELHTTHDSFGEDMTELTSLAMFLGTCDRLVALMWRQVHYLGDLLFEEEWAMVKGRIKTLVLFWFDSCRVLREDNRVVLRLNQAFGPPIRQWAITGREDISVVPCPFEHLEKVGIQDLSPQAPALRNVRLLPGPISTRSDGDIAYGRRPRNIPPPPPALSAWNWLLTLHGPPRRRSPRARGSLLESLNIGRNNWATLDVLLSVTRHTPELSDLVFVDCTSLPPSQSIIDHLTVSLPSLRFVCPLPEDKGPLANGIRESDYGDNAFSALGESPVHGMSALRLAGIL
ncbi:hypothetical protein BDK51DRAFT_37493 [Blyttiomyces helicus]|uniref:Uncharacterized protein n=1 Tax=Blyttiomyces helicus TaxID=388810 RepID=A0A4P9VYJ6_9FUNG|nr:hypothetical protein BDK51DRAFT_37493 [Blyttiomyces helicus]|eukprot:RKO84824.1 hypothetical protein BDK51DRAFT_37493 [Blyttiomyces helicus]